MYSQKNLTCVIFVYKIRTNFKTNCEETRKLSLPLMKLKAHITNTIADKNWSKWLRPAVASVRRQLQFSKSYFPNKPSFEHYLGPEGRMVKILRKCLCMCISLGKKDPQFFSDAQRNWELFNINKKFWFYSNSIVRI